MEGMRHMEAVDCLRFLRGRRLASKSRDGRVCVWDLAGRRQICAWKVRHPPYYFGCISEMLIINTPQLLCMGSSSVPGTACGSLRRDSQVLHLSGKICNNSALAPIA